MTDCVFLSLTVEKESVNKRIIQLKILSQKLLN